MMLALQIAAGIVLAALALKYPKRALWVVAGLIGLLLLVIVGIWLAGWSGEDWLALGVAFGVTTAGVLAYPHVKRIQERRQRIRHR